MPRTCNRKKHQFIIALQSAQVVMWCWVICFADFPCSLPIRVSKSGVVQLTDSGAESLFVGAGMEVGLVTLELRSNRLTLRGGRAARPLLYDHPCLESIDMRLNTTRKLGMLRVRPFAPFARASFLFQLLEDVSVFYNLPVGIILSKSNKQS